MSLASSIIKKIQQHRSDIDWVDHLDKVKKQKEFGERIRYLANNPTCDLLDQIKYSKEISQYCYNKQYRTVVWNEDLQIWDIVETNHT